MARKTFLDRLKQPSSWLIVVFILAFLLSLWNAQAAEAAELEATAGLGFGVSKTSPMVVQEAGLRINDAWAVAVARTGNIPELDPAWVIRAERIVTWREGRALQPMMALGVAWWDPAPAALVSEQWTFAMAVGLYAYEVVELRWQHYSTAGRADKNSGVDYISLTATMRF